MGKDSKQHKGDILDEKYNGPDEVIVVAGGAYYAHYWMALAGTAAGAALAMTFPKHSSQAVQKLRAVAEGWTSGNNKVQKWVGTSIHQIFGTGANFEELRAAKSALRNSRASLKNGNQILEGLDKHLVYQEKGFGFWLFDHTLGLIPPIKKWAKDATNFNGKTGDTKNKAELVSNAITSGGLLGMLGFTVMPWVYSFFEGSESVDRGRKQFKHAQHEIRELREDLKFMEKRNEELRTELRTARDEPMSVKRDETVSQDAMTLTKRKDYHVQDPTTSHAARHGTTAGKSHSEQALAKTNTEQIALGA